jgi:hypothetical protein
MKMQDGIFMPDSVIIYVRFHQHHSNVSGVKATMDEDGTFQKRTIEALPENRVDLISGVRVVCAPAYGSFGRPVPDCRSHWGILLSMKYSDWFFAHSQEATQYSLNHILSTPFKARKYWLQVKEIKIKVILYNLSKWMNSFLVLIQVEVFCRAQKGELKYFTTHFHAWMHCRLLTSSISFLFYLVSQVQS